MRRVRVVLAGLALVLLVPAGCGDDDSDDGNDQNQVPNPASAFCVEQGGEVEIVDEEEGQVGYCVLPDGTRIEEWEYYRQQGS